MVLRKNNTAPTRWPGVDMRDHKHNVRTRVTDEQDRLPFANEQIEKEGLSHGISRRNHERVDKEFAPCVLVDSSRASQSKVNNKLAHCRALTSPYLAILLITRVRPFDAWVGPNAVRRTFWTLAKTAFATSYYTFNRRRDKEYHTPRSSSVRETRVLANNSAYQSKVNDNYAPTNSMNSFACVVQ